MFKRRLLFFIAAGFFALIITSTSGLAFEKPASPSSSPIGTSAAGVPEMVYPADGQELDLQGGYMFKVKPVDGASGYLFGLFQDNVMVYENYRDTQKLSTDGEFALWEDNPAHTLFHTGEMTVMIRALVKGEWTDARKIIVILRPRGGSATLPSPKSATKTAAVREQISVSATDSSALQKRIDDLQKRLEESQLKQFAMETRLNEIINWIKSIFPFFKG